MVSAGLQLILYTVAAVLATYGVRHYVLTLHRLFARQSRLYEGIYCADWPSVTVFIPAHNEEAVIGKCLEALAASDYPQERLQIVPINDRSADKTGQICNEWAANHPRLVQPFHRISGVGGKPAALKDAAELAAGEVFVVFDADYVPGRSLLKQIVAPFLDPEVGLTMGRVVPYNVEANLLTRMLDMERSAGYQVDQQARHNLRCVPQYGGTVGGIRARALRATGGFTANTLSEDTDLTFRILGLGWKVAYLNNAECYEEVPESWPVRIRQLMRWSKGHNQALFRYLGPSLRNPFFTPRERVEAVFVLLVYLVAPLTVVGWIASLAMYFAGGSHTAVLPLLALAAYGGFGNAAAFFEMAAAVRLDGNRERVLLLPLNAIGYAVSAITITRGFLGLISDRLLNRQSAWDKTPRFRRASDVFVVPQ